MEENVRAYIIAQMQRQAADAEQRRTTRAKADRGLFEAWSARQRPRLESGASGSTEHARWSAEPTRVSPLAADRVLRGTTITGREDEEKRRVLPQGGGRGGPKRLPKADPVVGRAAPLTSRAGALARGYQPAVIKVVSYAHGAARASATANYVDRDDAILETHDGVTLKGRQAIQGEIAAWSKDFEVRAESQDVSSVRFHVAGLTDNDADRATLQAAMRAAFQGHRYAYRIETLAGGSIEARSVVAFAGTLGTRTETEWKDGAPVMKTVEERERFKVADRRIGDAENGFSERIFAPKSEARMKARVEEATGVGAHRISIEPGVAGNGQSSVVHRLTQLVERGPAIGSAGDELANAAAVQKEAREWRSELRSFKPRDTMHLIVSSKAGVDIDAFTNSVRGFLHEQFAEHRFMFGVHTDHSEKADGGHIHAHAIIAVRNAEGIKIHPGPQDFREWRQVFAEHAQTQGLKIVATNAAERASSQSYGPKDKAIVEAADRPRPGREARDRAYAADPTNQRLIDNARRRIETARSNPIKLPASEPQWAVVNDARRAWFEVAQQQPSNTIAVDLLRRVNVSAIAGDILAKIAFRVDSYGQQEGPMAAATSEQMSSDLRTLNETVDRVSQLLDPSTRETFAEQSARYLETLATRVDFTRMAERGQQAVSPAQIEAIAGVRAQRLIDRAQDVARTEAQEASAAERIAETTAAAERRDEAQAGLDATSSRDLLEERRAAAVTERDAAREEREAIAAREAARVIAQNPANVISQSLVEDEKLAALRREQERLAEEMKLEEKPQRQTHGQRLS